jgi:hypothetical protein
MTTRQDQLGSISATEAERCAEHLLTALQTLIGPDSPEAWQAERFNVRLRFALDRVAQLREASMRAGGVFEPARLEVAHQILDGHNIRAARFLDEIAERRLRAAARRYRASPSAQPPQEFAASANTARAA